MSVLFSVRYCAKIQWTQINISCTKMIHLDLSCSECFAMMIVNGGCHGDAGMFSVLLDTLAACVNGQFGPVWTTSLWPMLSSVPTMAFLWPLIGLCIGHTSCWGETPCSKQCGLSKTRQPKAWPGRLTCLDQSVHAVAIEFLRTAFI